MTRKKMFLAALGLGLAVFAVAVWFRGPYNFSTPGPYGEFSGNPRVEFVTEDAGAGREMKLLEDYSYTDPSGAVWTATAGYQTDGATIPPAFWSIVGGPFEGSYRNAAIIHDYFCDTESKPWQDVHRIFFYASLAAGVRKNKAKLLYASVMFGGPRWGRVATPSTCFSGCHQDIPGYEMKNGRATFVPDISEEEAAEIAKWIEEEDPTLDEIDAKVDFHPLQGMTN